MQRRAFLFTFATLLVSTLKKNDASSSALVVPTNDVASSLSTDERDFVCFVGSNARWLVDRRQGVVSAWRLNEARPLWSQDGVVFRVCRRPSDAFERFKSVEPSRYRQATEIFGRVYFLLDDAPADSDDERRDTLLVALDPRAQGRLVWRRRAQEFAPFFPAAPPRSLYFAADVEAAPNDELLVKIQAGDRVNRFALDAANGAFRSLEPNASRQ